MIKLLPDTQYDRIAYRNEVLRQAEIVHPDPRDELQNAINMAQEFGWEYVRIPTWVAVLAIEALHPVVQEKKNDHHA